MDHSNRPRISFVGAGMVGNALGLALHERGYPVVAVASRTPSSAAAMAAQIPGCQQTDVQLVAAVSDLVFVTTPDDSIPVVADLVQWRVGVSAVHCSGALGADVLEGARKRGAQIASFHPLQSFASVAQAVRSLVGSTFALEADQPLLGTLQEMAEALGGQWIRLAPEDRVLYHAAAVIVSNYTVGLVRMAADIWEQFGVSPDTAARCLVPLLRGTVENIANLGLPGCLTGPVARGDVGTVRRHVCALRQHAPHLLAAYRELGRQVLPVALAKGDLLASTVEQLEHELSG